MDQVVIITSINPPREEIRKFSKIKRWQLLVVGDLKTPKNWHSKNTIYMSPKDQEQMFPDYSKVHPWNRFTRKNLGYLYAIKNGAQLICDTDDDVFPYKNFPQKLQPKRKVVKLSGKKFINIYNFFKSSKKSELNSWPRGLPLNYINDQKNIKQSKEKVYSPMQTSVIDQDSDFDAIYRLVSDKKMRFKKSGIFGLAKGCYCPVNTQNTFTFPKAFPLLYLPAYANFHVDDIWRGYVAQRILWEINATQIFFYPTAYTSNRNAHNYLKDFEVELPLFLQSNKLVEILDSLSLSKDISKSLLKAYQAIVKHGILPKEELITVAAWVKEIEKLS